MTTKRSTQARYRAKRHRTRAKHFFSGMNMIYDLILTYKYKLYWGVIKNLANRHYFFNYLKIQTKYAWFLSQGRAIFHFWENFRQGDERARRVDLRVHFCALYWEHGAEADGKLLEKTSGASKIRFTSFLTLSNDTYKVIIKLFGTATKIGWAKDLVNIFRSFQKHSSCPKPALPEGCSENKINDTLIWT